MPSSPVQCDNGDWTTGPCERWETIHIWSSLIQPSAVCSQRYFHSLLRKIVFENIFMTYFQTWNVLMHSGSHSLIQKGCYTHRLRVVRLWDSETSVIKMMMTISLSYLASLCPRRELTTPVPAPGDFLSSWERPTRHWNIPSHPSFSLCSGILQFRH